MRREWASRASDLRIKGTGRSSEDKAFISPSHFSCATGALPHQSLPGSVFPSKTPLYPREGSEAISPFEGLFKL